MLQNVLRGLLINVVEILDWSDVTTPQWWFQVCVVCRLSRLVLWLVYVVRSGLTLNALISKAASEQ